MNVVRNRITVFVCSILLLSAGCSGMEMQSAFYGVYHGLEALNVVGEFVGDYRTTGVDLGPDATKEEIFTIKKYAFIQPWSLKKNVKDDDIRSISSTFLERLIQEVRRVSADKITTEEELITTSPALKEASDITAYIEAAHKMGLEAVITNNIRISRVGYLIGSFKFVMWDARASALGKNRLLLTMRGEFKSPKSIETATVSIANMFFKSADAPVASPK